MSGAQLVYNWSLTPLDYEPRDNSQIARKHIKMQMFCVSLSNHWKHMGRTIIEAAPDKIICCYQIIKCLLHIPRLNYERNIVIPKCFIRIASWGSWCNCIINFSESCSCRLNRGEDKCSAKLKSCSDSHGLTAFSQKSRSHWEGCFTLKDISDIFRNLPWCWQTWLV